jgi:hypothetical protein
MVAGGNRNAVQVFIVKGLANILDAFGSVLASGLNLFDATSKQAAVGINEIRHTNVGHRAEGIDVIRASTTNPGNTDVDRLIGADNLP